MENSKRIKIFFGLALPQEGSAVSWGKVLASDQVRFWLFSSDKSLSSDSGGRNVMVVLTALTGCGLAPCRALLVLCSCHFPAALRDSHYYFLCFMDEKSETLKLNDETSFSLHFLSAKWEFKKYYRVGEILIHMKSMVYNRCSITKFSSIRMGPKKIIKWSKRSSHGHVTWKPLS